MSVIWYLWLELWCRKLSIIIFWSLILPTKAWTSWCRREGYPGDIWRQEAENRDEWAPRQLSVEQVRWESIFGCLGRALPKPSWARGCLHRWHQPWQALNEEFGQWKITQILCPNGNSEFLKKNCFIGVKHCFNVWTRCNHSVQFQSMRQR